MKRLGLPSLARNCHSVMELEQARDQWWAIYESLEEALKYSASCLSDQERQSEALSNWQECLHLLEAVKSGTTYTFKK